MPPMKIAIVGLGAAGAAALLEAVASGCEAVGFEQFDIGHELGSSHGASRLIRRTYADAFHTRWMARAYEAWDRVEGITGENLFVRCGGLTFGPESDNTISETREALAACGIGHEWLSFRWSHPGNQSRLPSWRTGFRSHCNGSPRHE